MTSPAARADDWLRFLSHVTTVHGRADTFVDAYRQSPDVLTALLKLAGISTAADLVRKLADG